MQIEWPEKKEEKALQITDDFLVHQRLGWNAAIEACREAFDKAQGKELIPFDESHTAHLLDCAQKCWNGYESFNIVKFIALVKNNFGQPSPTPGKWNDDNKIKDYLSKLATWEIDNVPYINLTPELKGNSDNVIWLTDKVEGFLIGLCRRFATKTDAKEHNKFDSYTKEVFDEENKKMVKVCKSCGYRQPNHIEGEFYPAHSTSCPEIKIKTDAKGPTVEEIQKTLVMTLANTPIGQGKHDAIITTYRYELLMNAVAKAILQLIEGK